MNFSDPAFIIIVTSIVFAMPLIFLVYMAVKPGRSSGQACMTTVYLTALITLWVFGIIYLQMTLVPRLFGHMQLIG